MEDKNTQQLDTTIPTNSTQDTQDPISQPVNTDTNNNLDTQAQNTLGKLGDPK